MTDEFQAFVPNGIPLCAVFCQSFLHNLEKVNFSKRMNEREEKLRARLGLLFHISMNHEAALAGGNFYKANPIR